MKKTRLISTRKVVRRNPYIAALLSFFFTGAGQLYAGFPASGVAMLLGRSIPFLAMPLYVSVFIDSNYLSTVIFAWALTIIIWLISPVLAYYKLHKSKGLAKLGMFATPAAISIFIAINIIITVISIVFLCAVFGTAKVLDDTNAPNIRQADTVLVYKNGESAALGNIIVFTKDDKTNFGRLIAQKEENIRTAGGDIYIDGGQLELSSIDEKFLKKLSDKEKTYSLSEKRGLYFYHIFTPVKGTTEGNMPLSKKLVKGELFVAKDNRLSEDAFSIIDKSSVRGRAEGVIFSSSIKRVFTKMHLD